MNVSNFKWLASYWDADPERVADIVEPKDNLSLDGYRCCHGQFDNHAACSGRHKFIAIIPESRYDYEPPKPGYIPVPPAHKSRKTSAVVRTPKLPPTEQAIAFAREMGRSYKPAPRLAPPKIRYSFPPVGVTPYACRHGSMPGEICPECGQQKN